MTTTHGECLVWYRIYYFTFAFMFRLHDTFAFYRWVSKLVSLYCVKFRLYCTVYIDSVLNYTVMRIYDYGYDVLLCNAMQKYCILLTCRLKSKPLKQRRGTKRMRSWPNSRLDCTLSPIFVELNCCGSELSKANPLFLTL